MGGRVCYGGPFSRNRFTATSPTRARCDNTAIKDETKDTTFATSLLPPRWTKNIKRQELSRE